MRALLWIQFQYLIAHEPTKLHQTATYTVNAFFQTSHVLKRFVFENCNSCSFMYRKTCTAVTDLQPQTFPRRLNSEAHLPFSVRSQRVCRGLAWGGHSAYCKNDHLAWLALIIANRLRVDSKMATWRILHLIIAKKAERWNPKGHLA